MYHCPLPWGSRICSNVPDSKGVCHRDPQTHAAVRSNPACEQVGRCAGSARSGRSRGRRARTHGLCNAPAVETWQPLPCSRLGAFESSLWLGSSVSVSILLFRSFQTSTARRGCGCYVPEEPPFGRFWQGVSFGLAHRGTKKGKRTRPAPPAPPAPARQPRSGSAPPAGVLFPLQDSAS